MCINIYFKVKTSLEYTNFDQETPPTFSEVKSPKGKVDNGWILFFYEGILCESLKV
jgi:hypothetical protein